MGGSCCKKLQLSKEFWHSALEWQGRQGERCCEVCDRLVQFSDWLIRREQGVSQGFTLRVLRLQEAWGCVLLVIK